jgi:hypothetical protein
MFESSIRRVRLYFTRIALGHVFDAVTRISVVRQESYHDIRTGCIGLNPRDVSRPWAAVHRRPYLLIHELGHAFAERWLTAVQRARLAPVFGDYDAPYRRAPKPARADADHVSRYSMTHPAEDFAESFAVCLWEDWDAAEVERLMRGKSALCARKLAAVRRLVRGAARPSGSVSRR